jgi:hypothetical protein
MDRFGSAFNESPITDLFVGGTGAETNLYLPNYYTLKGNRYTILMAAETGEDSYASNIEEGIVTYYLTEGLKSRSTDTNKDTWVSAEEAFRYAAPKTASEIKSAGMYQNPRMFDGDSSHDVLMASYGSQAGSIYVTSNPAGATIYLDGASTGYTTPQTITGVAVRSHTVRCSLDGYTDQSQGVTVQSGQTTSVSFSLSPAQTPTKALTTSPTLTPRTTAGSLSVTSNPSGAIVYLHGTFRGVTPVTLSGVTAGSHQIRLIRTGYRDYSKTVTVVGGKRSSLPVTLTSSSSRTTVPITAPIPHTPTATPTATPTQAPYADWLGSLYVTSEPSGASVYLDNFYKGITPEYINHIPPRSSPA